MQESHRGEENSPTEKQSTVQHRSYLRRKLHATKETLIRLLKTGLTPQKLAHAVSVGFIAGLIPVYGTHMVAGMSAGFLLRLNQAGIIIGVFVSFPAYLLLLFPFLRLGEWVVGATPLQWSEFNASLKIMFQNFDMFKLTVQKYLVSFLHMNLGWLIGSAILYLPIYFTTLKILQTYNKIKNRAAG